MVRVEIDAKKLTVPQLVDIIDQLQQENSRLRGERGEEIVKERERLRGELYKLGGQIDKLCESLIYYGLDTNDWVGSVQKVLTRHLDKKI